MIDRSGGILTSLSFATPGVNMKFGIGHNHEAKNSEKIAETDIERS